MERIEVSGFCLPDESPFHLKVVHVSQKVSEFREDRFCVSSGADMRVYIE